MPVLQQGSTGADVTALQARLNELGFDPKGIDGNFGPGTKAAVEAFQQNKGLVVDGKVGPITFAALQLDAGADASGQQPEAHPITAQPAAATTAGAQPALAKPSRTATTAVAGLNIAALTGLVPTGVIAQIPETAAKFNITTNQRLAHFLAQCALESTKFTATVENLNYSATRLLQVFPKYFKGVDVNQYSNNPTKIGNRVYANRMGNGNEASGDGFKFRGRGYIQLTGKNNYTAFSVFIGEDCVANPDLVQTTYPLASAAFFFDENKIWAICDKGTSDANVTAVSKAVNGNPPHAVQERINFFRKFIAALT